MRMCLIVMAAALALLPQPGAAQGAFAYRGICDASAGISLDPDHFVVADDELNVLRIYRLGQADQVSSVPIQKFLGTKEKKESDLEGAARIGDRIYWISSHGTNSEGEVQDRRRRLFATDIVRQGPIPSLQPVEKPFAKLIESLVADKRFDKYGLATAAKIPPKEPGGLNIEGLAATPEGNLLIGFRNPIAANGALVVPLKHPEKVVAGADPEFLDPIEVKGLEGRGIRSIEGHKNGFLLIAGAAAPGGKFNLFRWTGKAADAAVVVDGVAFDGLNPEGLFVLPDGENIVVLSDDGSVKVEGVECKDLSDDQKSFRSLTLKP